MIILGINGINDLFHDASATIIVDNRIIASVEEERFNRKKHSNGIPFNAINFCLKKAGVQFRDIDHIGYYLDPSVLKKTFVDEIISRYKCAPDGLGYYVNAADNIAHVKDILSESFLFSPKTEFHYINHHVAHAGSAFYISGFEESSVLTIDGSGDRETSTLYYGKGPHLSKVQDFLVYPESLGFIYTIFANHLGLGWIEGPGKLMGLAGFGKPDTSIFEDIIFFQNDPVQPIKINLSYFNYHTGGPGFTEKGIKRFGQQRPNDMALEQKHFDLAASVQKALEKAIVHIVSMVPRLIPQVENLCFAGGVALNVCTNRRIIDSGYFKRVFVTPPAYDGGTSLGCALYLDAKYTYHSQYEFDVYCGPHIVDDYDVKAAVSDFHGQIEWTELSDGELYETAARYLAENKIIGWAQGRMECGPRALGNRSILTNAMNARAKDDLNTRVKLREPFRPYAPSVLEEYASDWFDLPVRSPFMLLEAMVHGDKRGIVPGIVHVDGTSRPQSVSEKANPRYYKLIKAFHEITGVPLILNTSFNRHGEPVVSSPDEAVNVLLETGMDALFIGNYYVTKKTTDYGEFSCRLREKWGEIPGTRQERVFSSDMLKWSDAELLSFWEECNRQTSVPEVRGWYQELYKDMFKGCEVADVGPGVGIDGIFFARHGANITFVDIVEDNLKLLERICTLKGIKAKYYYVDDFFNFHFENMFDVFLFIGSMINAPFEFTERQLKAMTPFLRNGGKIGMLGYPKERYDLSGAKDCAEFGKMTDGERTPWCEWYNDDKITSLFGDGFRLEWSRNFGKDQIEFNWFDLKKIEDEKVFATAVSEEKKAVANSRLNHPSCLWHNFKGEHMFTNGDTEGGLKAFANAIEKGPKLTVAYNNAGVVYWQKGDVEKAMQFLQRALEIGPNDRDATFNCINILIVLNKTEEAKKLYSDYLKNNREDDEMTSLFSGIEMPNHIEIGYDLSGSIAVPIVHVKNLHKQLEIIAPIDYPEKSLIKSLNEWKMEIDDSPIFRYIYRNVRPRRHLEFGTWQGTGVFYCLEECDATVWTINLLHGENKANGDVVYGLSPSEITDAHAWVKKIGLPEKDSYRTDSIGFIGRHYLDSGMGNRVCQIYSDSRKWDITNYPTGFFDTVLIDGGHAKDIVISDTRKAFQLLRPGGVIMWHDFCPPLAKHNDVVSGVTEGICHEWQLIRSQTNQLFWIYPSWILLGIKK